MRSSTLRIFYITNVNSASIHILSLAWFKAFLKQQFHERKEELLVPEIIDLFSTFISLKPSAMIHKYLLTHKHRHPNSQPVLPVSKIILYIGIVVLLAAFLYMVLDMDRADSIAALWLPFIIAGVLLVFLSLALFQMPYHKPHKPHHHHF